MMTTKVFQRVLAIFLVLAAIFLANGLNNVANAARVQIYDYSVNDILNDIRERGKIASKRIDLDFKIRGTHYYTGKDGFRYCESYFGESDKNRLIFQVNDNGAVSSACIISPIYTLAGEYNKEGTVSGLFVSSIEDVIGMSEDEYNKLSAEFKSWFNGMSKKIEQQRFNEIDKSKTFSVWCAKSKRYIHEQFNFNIDSYDSSCIILIYATT